MHIHILGICGTFMGGIAAIARAAGHTVTGCDANVYPPMSTQLATLGIDLVEGYDPAQLDDVAARADVFVVGNVVTRGNPLMEAILDAGRAYVSGPQWLYENVLRDKWVLAVAGTHGKTSVTAMLAWILERTGLAPGFVIGGVPLNFGVSARLADSAFFVIEADEYDTAFFDKRSKFVHYHPRTLILNNLEYDHADIFADLAAIETQFHHLVRTVPRTGRLIVNGEDEALARVLARGCWSEVEYFSGAELASPDGVPDAGMAHRPRRQGHPRQRAAGNRALAGRRAAARPAQSSQCARRARGRAARGRSGRRRALRAAGVSRRPPQAGIARRRARHHRLRRLRTPSDGDRDDDRRPASRGRWRAHSRRARTARRRR